MSRAELRAELEAGFRPYPFRNVAVALDPPEPAVVALGEGLSQTSAERFVPDWTRAGPNPGGSLGHHSRCLAAKLAWLETALRGEPQEQAAAECLRRLQAFWLKWAGYQATTAEELAGVLEAPR
ncbi:hypothetical protein [Deinococcus petrolearius]|uniref:Uncharacterized protein n=1 Tax=Deinococcus petrolearius TaxID=1751295 RepID=A0ABW1DK25_9DEIO